MDDIVLSPAVVSPIIASYYMVCKTCHDESEAMKATLNATDMPETIRMLALAGHGAKQTARMDAARSRAIAALGRIAFYTAR